jgi:hypothetical protein
MQEQNSQIEEFVQSKSTYFKSPMSTSLIISKVRLWPAGAAKKFRHKHKGQSTSPAIYSVASLP